MMTKKKSSNSSFKVTNIPESKDMKLKNKTYSHPHSTFFRLYSSCKHNGMTILGPSRWFNLII